jgi:hypothetical protein
VSIPEQAGESWSSEAREPSRAVWTGLTTNRRTGNDQTVGLIVENDADKGTVNVHAAAVVVINEA